MKNLIYMFKKKFIFVTTIFNTD